MYLHRSLGKEAQWDEVIYPGMKHALICAMQVSQDLVEGRKVLLHPFLQCIDPLVFIRVCVCVYRTLLSCMEPISC